MFRAGVSPDRYTLPVTFKAVSQVYSLETGLQLHKIAICLGVEKDEFVESSLINMYWKAGGFVDAHKMFDENPKRKLASWNVMIAGFSQNGMSRDAVDVFLWMRRSGFKPDHVAMVSVIPACGGLGDLNLAHQLHKYVFQVKAKREDDISMVNSVIDLYGKCGRMDLAKRVFDEMNHRNTSSWTSMIVGYASHGHPNEAIETFHAMIEAGVRPNHVTFVGVLSACVHGGMVDEGKRLFQMMKFYGVKPTVKHYGCIADLLGRAGLLEEARKFVKEMPMKPNVVIWGCLLGASERFYDVSMGELAAKNFLRLEPWNDGIYVVLSNIYAYREMWEKVEQIRRIWQQKQLTKLQGYSSM